MSREITIAYPGGYAVTYLAADDTEPVPEQDDLFGT